MFFMKDWDSLKTVNLSRDNDNLTSKTGKTMFSVHNRRPGGQAIAISGNMKSFNISVNGQVRQAICQNDRQRKIFSPRNNVESSRKTGN